MEFTHPTVEFVAPSIISGKGAIAQPFQRSSLWTPLAWISLRPFHTLKRKRIVGQWA